MGNPPEKAPIEKEKNRENIFNTLVDREGSIFSYGTLLDETILTKLLSITRGDTVKIKRVSTLEDLARLKKDGTEKNTVFILHGVVLENVRVNVIREDTFQQELARKTEKSFEDLVKETAQKIFPGSQEQQEQYINTLLSLPPDELILMVRSVDPKKEKPRPVKGGIIIGLTDTEIEIIDSYEVVWKENNEEKGLYAHRTPPQLRIGEHSFKPKHIFYYESREGKDFYEATGKPRTLHQEGEGYRPWKERAGWPVGKITEPRKEKPQKSSE